MTEQEIDPGVLAVDLDGTLLRSDMLYECFWSGLGQDFRGSVNAVRQLGHGKAQLKQALSEVASVDIATLPFDEDVIARVEDWRAKGGRTALVTATDTSIAEEIAAHLGIFDEVHGSDGSINLKAAEKARFLVERFGERGFVYMGDAEADLAVWERAGKAITVNAPRKLREAVAALGVEAEHIGAESVPAQTYLKALRPHQWMKNLLIFLPMLAAHQFTALSILQSVLAFVAFSAVASSVYVLNDLLDLSADRAHPRKKTRPFASGAIPIQNGTWMAAGLLGLGILISLFLGRSFLFFMLVYFATTTAYSMTLKRRIVVDICTLAILYTLRIVAGGAATAIPLSVWLLAFSIFFFLSLAAVKRQAELVDNEKRGKLNVSGRGYQTEDLPVISMMAISAGYVAVLVLALYVNSAAVAELYSLPGTLWGICLVLLYWISRIVMLTHRGHMHDDPVVFAVRDKNSRIAFLVILGFAIGGAVL